MGAQVWHGSDRAAYGSAFMLSVRRALHIISVSLITAGVVILSDVAMTLAWKEPLSTIYGSIQQGKAADELSALEDSFPSPADLRTVSHARSPEERVGQLAELFSERVKSGEGIGRIKIPRIDLDTVVVEGTTTAPLQKGPGRYPDTAFPGEGKTIGIAGHRTTYLAPFRRINEIEDGDEIILEMPYGTFTYTVEKHEIVDPSQVEIVDDVGYERLVLTACHPLYSAAQRWAVFAKLSDVSLFASGQRTWQDP
jgi:sortase A